MWVSSFFINQTIQDVVATLISFILAISWLRLNEFLVYKTIIDQKLSRKIIHIGIGILFVFCWNLFSNSPLARYLAALVPLVITLQFVAVGIGWREAPEILNSITRNNDPKELLSGPLHYGIVFVLITILFWRDSPLGIAVLMFLSTGDGLADIIGRRWGKKKLPFNSDKSWAGSIAMFVGSFTSALSFVILFKTLGYFQTSLDLMQMSGAIFILALIAKLRRILDAS